MFIHKGEILEKAVRKTEFPISLLAKRLGKSRRHIYNLFDKSDLSLDILLQIGKIIQYDFSKDFAELADVKERYHIDVLNDPVSTYETLEYWKSKYFELLDEHKLLLKNKLKEYFEK